MIDIVRDDGDKKKLKVSFSGGRSSAVMTKLIWDTMREEYDVVITFANTGCEDDRTLDFVHACETHWEWPVVWLEAKVHPRIGEGIKFNIVDYESASRDGKPFRDVVAKHGIFNQTSPACTTRLKEEVMNAYIRSIGWRFGKKIDHDTAIGIRSDEMDRVSRNRKMWRFVYPLVDAGITKRDVAIEIKKWPFDLQIPGDHFGNCTWCWKKSLRKHLTLAIEDPSVYDFPKQMEEEFGTFRTDSPAAKDGRRYWFRKHRSVDDLLEMSKTKEFTPYSDDAHDHAHDFDPELDVGSGSCGESCEIGADDD